MRTITLEEHFTTPAFRSGPGKKREEQAAKMGGPLAAIAAKLVDVGDSRIAEMDAAGIDMQVLSLNAPGTEQLEADAAVSLAQEANEFLAAAVKKYPKRFAGLAILPTAAPEKAAQELERLVRDNGFVGANIHGHNRGRYLDDKFYWPILERAEALGVPIYLHPTIPPQAVLDASFGGFSPLVTDLFSGPGWGWHIETAIHVLRMVFSGTLDKHPRLKLIIGHMGEMLPVMLRRIDESSANDVDHLKRAPSRAILDQVWITNSGIFSEPPFLAALTTFGIDRIMFSVDYPYAPNSMGRKFLDTISLAPADMEKLTHKNADALLKLKAT